MQMNMTDEEKIRARAYQLWEERGQREGGAMDHWLEAEREVMASEAPSKKPRKPRSTASTKAKSARA